MGIEQIRQIKEQSNQPKEKKIYRIPKVSEKKKKQQEELKKSLEPTPLEKYFMFHMKHSDMVCDNCGKSLRHYNAVDWRGSQHHIFEKQHFKSLEANLDNHLVLGKWCCHPQWHTNYQNASKMEAFKLAIPIIKKLYPLIPQNEIRFIPDEYLKVIENY